MPLTKSRDSVPGTREFLRGPACGSFISPSPVTSEPNMQTHMTNERSGMQSSDKVREPSVS